MVKRQPQPPSPHAAVAPGFLTPADFFFAVGVVVDAGFAAVVVVAGAATAFVAGAASAPDLVGIASACGAAAGASPAGFAAAASSLDFSAFAAPQAPFAEQLAFAPCPSPLGTSVAGELAWLPAHAEITAPDPITANAAANLLIFNMILVPSSCGVVGFRGPTISIAPNTHQVRPGFSLYVNFLKSPWSDVVEGAAHR